MVTMPFRTILRRTARNEEGWAMITALILLSIMMSTSLALLSYLDNQTTQTAKTRQRETAFNFAEAALNAQIYGLSQTSSATAGWPGSSTYSYSACTQANTNTGQCPSDSRLKALFPTADADPGETWETRIIDNQGSASTGADALNSFYSDALAASLNAPGWTTPGYDKNGDGRVWVRAQATIRGRTRKLVALVREESQYEEIPHAAVISGSINITNSGNKVFVNGGTGGVIAVRCNPASPTSAACLGQPESSSAWSKAAKQISPWNTVASGNPIPNAMTDDAIARMRDTAKKTGTYVTDCATLGREIPTGVVFAEGGACNFNPVGNTPVNSATKPGVIINLTGTIALTGNTIYYGIVYAANRNPSDTTQTVNDGHNAVTFDGTAIVYGGVLIDGNAALLLGSSGGNNTTNQNGQIIFDDNGYKSIQSIATAGVIQNTWRELTPR
jgi:Tfp pilus assembly protein PilX